MGGIHDQIAYEMEAIYTSGDTGVSISYNGSSITGFIQHLQHLAQQSGNEMVDEEAFLTVLKSDVPAWTYRDSIVISGETWTVQSQEYEDPARFKLLISRDERMVI